MFTKLAGPNPPTPEGWVLLGDDEGRLVVTTADVVASERLREPQWAHSPKVYALDAPPAFAGGASDTVRETEHALRRFVVYDMDRRTPLVDATIGYVGGEWWVLAPRGGGIVYDEV